MFRTFKHSELLQSCSKTTYATVINSAASLGLIFPQRCRHLAAAMPQSIAAWLLQGGGIVAEKSSRLLQRCRKLDAEFMTQVLASF